ncbi:ricin-type beta-trefoil lectin domain protein [Kitasatospora sp. NPDC056531]|uniref:ricin-type beta-trefoil lectin domain protein n=1 Tax=Kitasatospora sp. NPDC056531 TaxID=3345856 RepID=UPI0036C34AB1
MIVEGVTDLGEVDHRAPSRHLGVAVGRSPAPVAEQDLGVDPKKFTFATDGTLRSGLCATVQNNRTDNGAPVVLATCNGQTGQVWTLTTDGTLLNPKANKVIELPGWSDVNGQTMDIWTTLARPTPTSAGRCTPTRPELLVIDGPATHSVSRATSLPRRALAAHQPDHLHVQPPPAGPLRPPGRAHCRGGRFTPHCHRGSRRSRPLGRPAAGRRSLPSIRVADPVHPARAVPCPVHPTGEGRIAVHNLNGHQEKHSYPRSSPSRRRPAAVLVQPYGLMRDRDRLSADEDGTVKRLADATRPEGLFSGHGWPLSGAPRELRDTRSWCRESPLTAPSSRTSSANSPRPRHWSPAGRPGVGVRVH